MITTEFLEKLFPTKGLNPNKYNLVRHRAELVEAMNRILPKYRINNQKRVCAFLANCGIETDYFRTTSEYASGAAYEWRKDLGNVKIGDGRKFKGRGLTQTTGRYNYGILNKAVGERLGIDFLKNPEKLNEIEIAVESACIFFDDHFLNAYADRGEFKQLSGIVNRGDKNKTPLHWAKRNELYSKCKRVIPADFSFSVTLPLHTEDEPIQAVTGNTVIANLPAEQTTTIKELSDKYLKHLPTDPIKNAVTVATSRASAAVVTAWSFGLTWKIILIIAIIPIIYTLWYYRQRILNWAKVFLESQFGGLF